MVQNSFTGSDKKWSRELESNQSIIQKKVKALDTSNTAINKNLEAKQALLTRQQTRLKEQQELLEKQQDQLTEQQAQIIDMISFLSGQQGYDSNVGQSFTRSYTSSSNNVEWQGFDPTYDPSTTLTVPSTGVIFVNTSAYLHVGVEINNTNGGNWVQVIGFAYVSFEILSGSTIVNNVSSTRGCRSYYNLYNNIPYKTTVARTTSGVDRVFGLTPGDEITVRTRRGLWTSIDTGTNIEGIVNFQIDDQRLQVTKAGM